MTALPLPDNLTGDASWLVQAIDPRARLARLVHMDGDTYRAASFLDDRLLSATTKSRLCGLDELVAAAEGFAAPPAGWIFHIGHVGSTLVSRLLGELPGVLSLREPRALRDLAVAGSERPRLARALSALMARRGPTDRTVIIKATSFVSEYVHVLAAQGDRALFLYASLPNYVAGILAGENSVKELAALHDQRLERLASREIVLQGFDRSDAFRAAAAWACEMTSLEAGAETLTHSNALWADFDAMLTDMPLWLGRVAEHFGVAISPQRADELAASELMRRYSKAPEYDYSPSLRAELLTEATRQHRPEIRAAVAALRDAAKSAPMLARAMNRAEREI